jgi:hypothetical protein
VYVMRKDVISLHDMLCTQNATCLFEGELWAHISPVVGGVLFYLPRVDLRFPEPVESFQPIQKLSLYRIWVRECRKRYLEPAMRPPQ